MLPEVYNDPASYKPEDYSDFVQAEVLTKYFAKELRYSPATHFIADEILRFRDMRKQAEVDSVVKDEQLHLIQDLQDFIKSQPTTITKFDETLDYDDHSCRRRLHRGIQIRSHH